MPRSRSGSVSRLAVNNDHSQRPRSRSRNRQIESAISAIQQRESLAREARESTSAAFTPGTGGFVGGPPAHAGSGAAGATAGAATTKVRHRKDPTHYILNGKSVSTVERICKDVPKPVRSRPSERDFWSYANPRHPLPSLSFLRSHFYAEGRLTEDQAMYILDATALVLEREPNMISVGDGVTVCGDIHGQYYDLLKLFEIGGDPRKTPYLFLGDYVDRGAFGIECLLYLYALKLHYPTTFFLLRGNHECRHLTEYFTFKIECLHKYSSRVYEACVRSFRALPIAALLDERFLCVHGGISPDMKTLADLKRVDRFHEPGMEGILCDILWADPIPDYSRVPDPKEPLPPRVRRYPDGRKRNKGSKSDYSDDDLLPRGFTHNNIRGCSYFYSYTAVCDFLKRNNLTGVVRGHEAQDMGYSMYRTTSDSFPSLITIFSAPNYLDAYKNRAAVIKYADRRITIRQFNSSPHPYSLEGFMDAFTWSLPFVGSKITEMLLAILNICTQEELEGTDDDGSEDDVTRRNESNKEQAQRSEAIKNKVLAVGRMARVFDLLREESEGVSELSIDGGSSESQARASKLGIQGQKIKKAIHNFEDARRSDIRNERIPISAPPSPSSRSAAADPSSSAGRSSSASYSRSSAQRRSSSGWATEPTSSPHASPSLTSRRRSTTDDTKTRIRRTLMGEGDEEKEILQLAMRLSKPLTGKDVKKVYVGSQPRSSGTARKGIRRTETA